MTMFILWSVGLWQRIVWYVVTNALDGHAAASNKYSLKGSRYMRWCEVHSSFKLSEFKKALD
jgi:hypothetical protein